MKKSVALLLTVILVATVATVAVGQTLEELLSQVGEDYATAYASPFLYGFGPNQNANLYNTASIPWGKLTFGVGLKAMGTYLNEADQSFRTATDVDLSDYNDYFPVDFPVGTPGTIVMGGPTMFGDTGTPGRISIYQNGVEIFGEDTIPGLVDTRWVPMFTPEGYIGGFFGFRGLIRWLPSFDVDKYGTFSYMGLGLQWSTTGVLKDFPVDLMVGYFSQEMDVSDYIKSTGTSLHFGVSKAFPALTLYGGYAIEDSEMDVKYTWHYTDPVDGLDKQEDIAFTVPGRQDHRWTLGVTLDILAKLNFEMGHGDLTTYSVGLMFGN